MKTLKYAVVVDIAVVAVMKAAVVCWQLTLALCHSRQVGSTTSGVSIKEIKILMHTLQLTPLHRQVMVYYILFYLLL